MHCSNCGTEITKKIPKSKLERNKNFFCSKSCYREWWGKNVVSGERNVNWKGGRVERACFKCNVAFTISRNVFNRGYGIFCSSKCYGQYNAYRHQKENNVNWKGGVSREYDKIKRSAAYKEWRAEVYKRDYWTCKSCGYKGNDIVAHHIKSFADYPELRFDVGNGITLCRSCHIKLHSPHTLPKSVETIYAEPRKGEDRVRTAQECVEPYRNDLALRVNEE